MASDLDELTLGANVAVHLRSDDSTPVQVSVQGGFGWVKFDDPETVTSFPIGVALQGRPSGNATTITPWVMPRLDIQHSSQFSSTETNFGAAAGLSVNSEGGADVHLAIDWVHTDFFHSLGSPSACTAWWATDRNKACGAASISNEQCGISIRAMHEGERPKPLPHRSLSTRMRHLGESIREQSPV